MKIPFLAWLLQGIPECIALAALVISLGSKKVIWKQVVTAGIIQAIIAYVIRLLPFTPYAHVFILIPTLAFLTAFAAEIDIRLAHIHTILAFLVLYISEAGIIYLMDVFEVVTLEEIFNNMVKRIMVGIPQVIILFCVAGLVGWIKRETRLVEALKKY